MNPLEKLEELDRRAEAARAGDIDVSGAVIARIRAGERQDAGLAAEATPFKLLAGASLLAVAAALVVVVVVWAMFDTHTEAVDVLSQQTAGWLQ